MFANQISNLVREHTIKSHWYLTEHLQSVVFAIDIVLMGHMIPRLWMNRMVMTSYFKNGGCLGGGGDSLIRLGRWSRSYNSDVSLEGCRHKARERK